MPDPLGGWSDYRSERTAFVPWVEFCRCGPTDAERIWQEFESRQASARASLDAPHQVTLLPFPHPDANSSPSAAPTLRNGMARGLEPGYAFQIGPTEALIRCSVEGPEFWSILDRSLASCGLAWALLSGGILFHASSVLHHGVAHLFSGPSGIGKTTLATWASKAGATLVSVDQTLVVPSEQEPHKWLAVSGDTGPRTPQPLSSISILRRGRPTAGRRLSGAAALKEVLPNAILWPGAWTLHEVIMERALDLVRHTAIRELTVDLDTLSLKEVVGG